MLEERARSRNVVERIMVNFENDRVAQVKFDF